MRKRYTIRVKGKVQGVFFRATTREKAESLSLCGLVRNEPDGSVYIEVEGDQKDIQSFLLWCHQGPPLARVDECDVAEGPLKNFNRFVVER